MHKPDLTLKSGQEKVLLVRHPEIEGALKILEKGLPELIHSKSNMYSRFNGKNREIFRLLTWHLFFKTRFSFWLLKWINGQSKPHACTLFEVYSTAPALSIAPVHVPTAGSAAVATTLPLLTMRGAGLVDSEAVSDGGGTENFQWCDESYGASKIFGAKEQ